MCLRGYVTFRSTYISDEQRFKTNKLFILRINDTPHIHSFKKSKTTGDI